jgi:hypothetical protein
METKDLLLGGAVVVGGYFAWKWWKSRPVSNAAQTAPKTFAGAAASSMTESAARTTVFGASFTKRLLSPLTSFTARLGSKPLPTSGPGPVVAQERSTFGAVRAQVLNATLAPMPVAPSPDGFIRSSVGILAPIGTMPSGDQPSPGDPLNILQTRGIA